MNQESASAWNANAEIAHGYDLGATGRKFALLVSPSEENYWQEHFANLAAPLTVLTEPVPKGNFLGTLAAYEQLARQLPALSENAAPTTWLLTMLFGQGTRLSPFTQILGGSKSTLPVPPLKGSDHSVVGDLAIASTLPLLQLLENNGFSGLVVKWGDEAILPGLSDTSVIKGLPSADAVRFVWETSPTETLAREKDWVVFSKDGLMLGQISRRPVNLLQEARRTLGTSTRLEETPIEASLEGTPIEASLEGTPIEASLGVNVGGLALSHAFLEHLNRHLRTWVEGSIKIDWDPYVWMALTTKDATAWAALREAQAAEGLCGIADLETQVPDFFERLLEARQAYEQEVGRPLRIHVLSLGEPLWLDLGLHTTLRAGLTSLLDTTPSARALRTLFGLPQERDANGNTLVNCDIAKGASVKNSLVVNAYIGPTSRINNAVVLGGYYERLDAPFGGCAIECYAQLLIFRGANGVALRVFEDSALLAAGGRAATLVTASPHTLYGNEAGVNYSSTALSQILPPNAISFAQAGKLAAAVGTLDLDLIWANKLGRYRLGRRGI